MRVRVEVCPGVGLEGWLRCFTSLRWHGSCVLDNGAQQILQRLLAAGQCVQVMVLNSVLKAVVAGLHIRITWGVSF